MAPVLLIPGLVSDGHVWKAARAALAARGLASAVADLTDADTIPAMADALLARHPGRRIVAGHSLGGRVAMAMVARAPDRLAGLALLNTGMHPMRPGEAEGREAAIALSRDHGMDALADAWLPGMMAQGRDPDPAVMAGLRAMVGRADPALHARQVRALMARPDAARTMGAWTGPLLLMTGRLDAFSPVADHEAIARLCPQAELHVVEDAGHFAPVERPAAVADRLAAWAVRVAAGGTPPAS